VRDLIKNKVFIGMFLLSYYLFFVITIFILDLKNEGVGAGHLEYGFPFTYYYSHCFGGYYLWFGLVGNILSATALGIIIGLVSTHFWLNWLLPFRQMVSSREFRSKWYL
jgi:hypothetical protein